MLIGFRFCFNAFWNRTHLYSGGEIYTALHWINVSRGIRQFVNIVGSSVIRIICRLCVGVSVCVRKCEFDFVPIYVCMFSFGLIFRSFNHKSSFENLSTKLFLSVNNWLCSKAVQTFQMSILKYPQLDFVQMQFWMLFKRFFAFRTQSKDTALFFIFIVHVRVLFLFRHLISEKSQNCRS